ncbi:MAG: hypothetical protein M5U01_23930 [Ardenticatenaceae bacterium]|nr:hypothetical protein [Ardenticatenaceae bacterium]
MRLTRDAAQGRGPATDSPQYRKIGKQVHQSLAFVYFYPALKSGDDYRVVWPWENETMFRRRFLSSYPGTALSYPQQSAAEGTLHEVEFISPNTLDTGEAVFLAGYVFEREGCTLNWRSALKRLQMGGERGYGWGDVEVADIRESADEHLFGGPAIFDGKGDAPSVHLPADGRLLAHTLAEDLPAAGDIEPLAGREWRSDDSLHRYAGQHVEFCDICFAPGSVVHQALDFAVEKFGMWRGLDDKA